MDQSEGLAALERAARSGEGLEEALERLPKKASERAAWLTAALVAAAASGSDDTPQRVAMLIDRGADPNASHHGRPPLHEAASRGHLPTIEMLLDRGADLDGVDCIENTPLMCATNSGQEAAMRHFVDRGATLSHATSIGETALTTAIDRFRYRDDEEPDLTCVDLLLEAGAPVSGPRRDSPRTPLRSAVEVGHLPLAKRLVEAGADPHQTSMDDGLMHLAAKKGHLPVVRWLDELGVPLDGGYRTPIEGAAERGHTAVVRFLMERGQELDALALLHGAAQSGDLDGIALALELGAEVDAVHGYGDDRALIVAANANQADAVAALLKERADPNGQNGRGESAMSVARDDAVKELLRGAGALEERLELVDVAEKGDLAEVRAMLEGGARPDVAIAEYGERRGLTPLMAAAGEGHADVVRALIDAGANPNRVDDDQWSAAMHAADGGHLAVVQALIDAGADLRLVDRQRFGAHDLAVEGGHDAVREALEAVNAHRDLAEELHEVLRNDDAEALDELIALGLDPATIFGRDHLLARAAYDGRWAIVRRLFEREPELAVDDLRQYGKTPLMCAAMKGDVQAFEELLGRGADLTLTDDDGWTPFVIACGNHADGIVRLLLEKERVDDAQLSAGLRTCLDHPSPEVLVELLNRGPILDARDRRQVMAAQMIVDEGEDVPIRFDDDEEALRCAVLEGHGALVRFLLEKGVEPKPAYPEDPPLVSEVRDPAVLQAFIDSGAPMDGALARMCGRLYGPEDEESLPSELFDVLLERCDVNETDGYGTTALMSAARAGHRYVGRLIEAGADVSAESDGRTAISEAAQAGYPDTVRQLTEAGADLSAVDHDGRTLPMLLARGGDLEGARTLIDAGAPVAGLALAAAQSRDAHTVREALALEGDAFDPTRKDRDGWTLGAHVAAMADQELLAEVLERGVPKDDLALGAAGSFDPAMIAHVVELGAPLDATDQLGRTALHIAASEGALECATELLDRGADPSIADGHGITPLMEAVDADSEDVARLLVMRGADKRAKDADGRSAHDRVWHMAPKSLKKLVQP